MGGNGSVNLLQTQSQEGKGVLCFYKISHNTFWYLCRKNEHSVNCTESINNVYRCGRPQTYSATLSAASLSALQTSLSAASLSAVLFLRSASSLAVLSLRSASSLAVLCIRSASSSALQASLTALYAASLSAILASVLAC